MCSAFHFAKRPLRHVIARCPSRHSSIRDGPAAVADMAWPDTDPQSGGIAVHWGSNGMTYTWRDHRATPLATNKTSPNQRRRRLSVARRSRASKIRYRQSSSRASTGFPTATASACLSCRIEKDALCQTCHPQLPLLASSLPPCLPT